MRKFSSCVNCLYYAPLVGRSYNLSKCLKLEKIINVARDECKGELYFPKQAQNYKYHKYLTKYELTKYDLIK
jgi:hypothetical protein